MTQVYPMKWEKATSNHSPRMNLFAGKWLVGSVYWDSLTSSTNLDKYVARTVLPGLKSSQGHFRSQEKAQEKLEKAVVYWIERLVHD